MPLASEPVNSLGLRPNGVLDHVIYPSSPSTPPYVPLPMGLWPVELRSRSARRRSWEFLGGSWASTRNPSTPQPHLPINASAPQPCPAEWAVRLNNKYYVVYVRVVVMLLCVRCYVWY